MTNPSTPRSQSFEQALSELVDRIETRVGNTCTGFGLFDHIGLSFAEPGVTYIGAARLHGRSELLATIAIRHSIVCSNQSLLISLGHQKHKSICDILCQLTNKPAHCYLNFPLSNKDLGKIHKFARNIIDSPLRIAELAIAKPSLIEAAIAHAKNMSKVSRNDTPPLVVLIDGAEEIGRSFDGNTGAKAYRSFTRFLHGLAYRAGCHIVTTWPLMNRVNKREISEVQISDLICYEEIKLFESTIITLYRKNLYNFSPRKREKILLAFYDSRLKRKHAAFIEMYSSSRKILSKSLDLWC